MKKKILSACVSHVDLCNAINVSGQSLNRAIDNRSYQTFTIKKPNGGKRRIEHPNANLGTVQRRLAVALNNSYGPFLPPCTHGYIPKVISGESRDIFSNAISHQGCKYMLNVDAKDFFHSIDKKKIALSVNQICPGIDRSIIKIITKIVTYGGRLPMGAPSSPVLSNIASLQMDLDLVTLSNHEDITYTRYVDDLSFSSKKKVISDSQQDRINKIVSKHGFSLNPKKKKLYGPKDDKIITGIIVEDDNLEITAELYEELIENIKKLKRLKTTYQHMKMLDHQLKEHNRSRFKQYKSSVKGQINFIERVLGDDSEKFQKLKGLLDDVLSDNNYITQSVYI